MNLTTINKATKAAFHSAGYKGQGITVALIDSGCNLKDSRVTSVLDAPDTQNHGTMIASLLLDWLPEARILSYNIKAFSVTDALTDILQMAKQGGRYLVNISQGMGYDAEHERLINELVALNVPVFCAAGNDGNESIGLYPSHYYAPICVAALDNTGERAPFSTFHHEVDFSEVGMGVVVDGKVYNGTSVACPILLAKAALMLCQTPMTEPQLFAALKAQAADLGAVGKDPYTGYGHVPAMPMRKEEKQKVVRLTPKQLVAYFQKAVSDGWGYVWALNGELYSREKAEYFHKIQRNTSPNRDPKTYWLKDCAKWIGKMAADCSGGIVGAFRSVDPSYKDTGANTFFSQCTEKGKISTIPEIPGLCVWRDGHIGIYEGSGYALEFRGTDYGCVRTKLKDRDFTNWGKLRDIQYETEVNIVPKVITKNLAYDADVQALQNVLNALGYPCGVADGKAGDNTMKGIAAFCTAHSEPVTVEKPATLPDAITLTVGVGDKKYTIEMK